MGPVSVGYIVAVIVSSIQGHRFNYANEDQLQEGLAAMLAGEGFDVEREVRLSGRDRIDLLVGDVGIEVKVAGQAGRVLAQLTRYAEHDRIGALVLVTTRVSHDAPPRINGKPVALVSLVSAGL